MVQGSYGKYQIRNQPIHLFLPIYVRVLSDCQFRIKHWSSDGTLMLYKAVYGDEGAAFLMSHFVPFGSLTETGNRYGVESEIFQWGPDVIIRILVAPYMSIFDRHDIFLISQGVFEKILDDERCREKLQMIINRIMAYGLQVYYSP